MQSWTFNPAFFAVEVVLSDVTLPCPLAYTPNGQVFCFLPGKSTNVEDVESELAQVTVRLFTPSPLVVVNVPDPPVLPEHPETVPVPPLGVRVALNDVQVISGFFAADAVPPTAVIARVDVATMVAEQITIARTRRIVAPLFIGHPPIRL